MTFQQLALGILLLCTGCTSLFQTTPIGAVALPHERTFRKRSLIFHSDADVSVKHPLFLELASFPEQVCKSLDLPVTDRTIQIYLFKDRGSFEQYVHAEFKDIPSRRALFVQRPADTFEKKDQLQVLCYWGDRIQDDLRHELTHATLHSVLQEVPLWLDEGLAMYFETGIAAQGKHQRILKAFEPDLQSGTWKCDLQRLMSLQDVSQMGLADYHEAWAWVHYLMHSTPENRKIVLNYLKCNQADKAGFKFTLEREALEQHVKTLLVERSSWPHG